MEWLRKRGKNQIMNVDHGGQMLFIVSSMWIADNVDKYFQKKIDHQMRVSWLGAGFIGDIGERTLTDWTLACPTCID